MAKGKTPTRTTQESAHSKAAVRGYESAAEFSGKLWKEVSRTPAIFNPNDWGGLTDLGFPAEPTAFPPDSLVKIEGSLPVGGEQEWLDIVVRGLIPETFSESSRTRWGDVGQASWGFEIGKKALLAVRLAETFGKVKTIEDLLAKFDPDGAKTKGLIQAGKDIANNLLGFGLLSTTYEDIFEGSESLNLSVDLDFFMYPGAKDAYTAVYLPTRLLQGLQLPGVSVVRMTIPKYATIQVGNILKLKNVVITGVNIDWGDKLDAEGYPISSHISLDVRTARILLANDIAAQLKRRK